MTHEKSQPYACTNGIGYRNPGAVQVARSSRTMSATTELKFRARLQHPQAPMDDSRGVLPDPGESALKARDLGNAFENPDAPREYTDAEMSGMTLMSNSPDAFKGREIRVTHAQPCRFDDRTTNKDHFPGHHPDSRCASRPHPRIIQPSSRFGDVRGCYPVPGSRMARPIRSFSSAAPERPSHLGSSLLCAAFLLHLSGRSTCRRRTLRLQRSSARTPPTRTRSWRIPSLPSSPSSPSRIDTRPQSSTIARRTRTISPGTSLS